MMNLSGIFAGADVAMARGLISAVKVVKPVYHSGTGGWAAGGMMGLSNHYLGYLETLRAAEWPVTPSKSSSKARW